MRPYLGWSSVRILRLIIIYSFVEICGFKWSQINILKSTYFRMNECLRLRRIFASRSSITQFLSLLPSRALNLSAYCIELLCKWTQATVSWPPVLIYVVEPVSVITLPCRISAIFRKLNPPLNKSLLSQFLLKIVKRSSEV